MILQKKLFTRIEDMPSWELKKIVEEDNSKTERAKRTKKNLLRTMLPGAGIGAVVGVGGTYGMKHRSPKLYTLGGSILGSLAGAGLTKLHSDYKKNRAKKAFWELRKRKDL